jgi:glycosyltransferase involved in cell wall biosynthesis
MTAKNPLVSIITPVYNGETYLAECIDSVLGQTYTNWEYVIVNNCSTDNTEAIARSYSKRDPRIRVHNNPSFLSLIDNWNHAIVQVSPKSTYFKELHADDQMMPECLEKMVAVAERHSDVGIVSSYILIGTKVKADGVAYATEKMDGRHVSRETFRGCYFLFGSPSSLLIRSQIIQERTPFYRSDYLHADTEACYAILQKWDLGFVHQVLTYTRLHEASQTETFAVKYRTNRVEHLIMLHVFGPKIFTPSEFKAIWRQRAKEYYRMLANDMVSGRPKDFISFHRNKLASHGIKLNTGMLFIMALRGGGDQLLNPKRLIGNLIRARIGRR